MNTKSNPSKIIILSAVKSTYLKMPWQNCISVGRAYDLTRQDLLDHLQFLNNKIGYRYCRFHAIFDDDMGVVTRDNNGKLEFHWHQVNKVYDSLLQMGLKPFVELNPMPGALASGSQTMFDFNMNVTLPKSYHEWGQLITNFVEHLIARYGLDEVKQWYFEVWNEPNLSAFFAGTKEDYWELYKTSALAIKQINADLRVGGPATSKGSWIQDIIDYCQQNNVPLDFISTHLYPQDEFVEYHTKTQSPHAIGMYFIDKVNEVEKIVRSSSMPALPIHWTEWNTQSARNQKDVTWLENIFVDNLYAASCIIHNCVNTDSAAETLCYWVASDIFFESGLKHSPFSSTYGLLNIHGIPKASFNAFYFLNKMKGSLQVAEQTERNEFNPGVLVTREGDNYNILLWNHIPIEIADKGRSVNGVIEIPNMKFEKFSIIKSLIAEEKGSAWEAWKKMGSPENLTNMQTEFLLDASAPGIFYEDKSATDLTIRFDFHLNANEVMYVSIEPLEKENSERIKTAQMEAWNQGMGEKSRV